LQATALEKLAHYEKSVNNNVMKIKATYQISTYDRLISMLLSAVAMTAIYHNALRKTRFP